MLSAYDTMSATQQASARYEIRVANPSDRAFILSSWIHGARASRWARESGMLYYAAHGRAIEAAFERPGVTTRVACVTGEPAAILGYAVLEQPERDPPVLHWVHVRPRCGGQGIARALLQPIIEYDVVYCSHWVPASHGRWPSMFRYNPYCLFF